ncbi:MAG: histidine triad nucleotide-binding protein [Burkholderiaceae bacterium]
MTTHDPDCLFCKIAAGQIPANKVYEDDDLVAFHDINPGAPVHFLIIPREHIRNLYDVQEPHQALIGKMFSIASRLARDQGLDDGFRIVVNNGRIARQEVYHLHVHVLGGPEPLRAAAKPAQ